jgi:hypothetical protein
VKCSIVFLSAPEVCRAQESDSTAEKFPVPDRNQVLLDSTTIGYVHLERQKKNLPGEQVQQLRLMPEWSRQVEGGSRNPGLAFESLGGVGPEGVRYSN